MQQPNKIDWAEEKAAGWAGRDIHGCFTTDKSRVVTEAELKAACEAQLYGAPIIEKKQPTYMILSDGGPGRLWKIEFSNIANRYVAERKANQNKLKHGGQWIVAENWH